MCRSGKVTKKAAKKPGEKMGKVWENVKKSVRFLCLGFGGVGFMCGLWEKSGKIYTKNLCNFICPLMSFPDFTQTTITTTYLNKKITK